MPAELFQPTIEQLRDQYLRDVRLAALDAGLAEPPIQPGSDNYMTATAIAGVAVMQFANINAAEAAANVLDAVGEDLDRIREAEGLPEVTPGRSFGKIVVTIAGPTTIPDGTPFTMPNGKAGVVVGAYVNPADRSLVDVQSVETGSATNLAGGSIVRFDSPPSNVATEATVSDSFPLRGGDDGEDDARKRERILNARRNRPGGGNWGQIRQWALEAVPSVQDCYVYPTLGGPGSAKVVPVRPYDAEFQDFSRTLTDAELQAVRSYIQSKMPVPQEIVVQAAADEDLDVTLKLTLPASALAGGNGQGWADPAPWPPTPSDAVTVTAAAASNDQITVDAATSTSPLAGLTHVAWWSPSDREFHVRLVTAVSGSSGAWVLTLDAPLLDKSGNGPAVGDYVSPAAFNMTAYARAWLATVEAFGTGENTADTDRLPRARRHPYTTDEDPTDITNATIAQWSRQFPEITGFTILYASATTPTVPALVATAPNVFVPRHFAIYEL